MNKIADFDIHYSQTLNELGELSCSLDQLLTDGFTADTLVELYQWMQLARTFDHKAIALQRTGRIGTYASCMGQEAIGAAIGKAMREEDVFVQSYRETTTLLCRGVKLEEMFLYWGGDERGMDYEVPRQDMPGAVPIASQCLHAVGISYAFKLRQQPRVCVVVVGDGGTSKGDFYEALNAAGVWQLPLIFIVCNNQWAISVPRSLQSATETLAQKAIAGGLSGEQVDGNDVIGCYLAVDQAIKRAREGKGPHLIEAMTYRLSDHTTADDARRYRDEEVVKNAWEREPIARFRTCLINEKLSDKAQLEAIDVDCKSKVEDAVNRYMATEPQTVEAMFQYLYQDTPRYLEAQLKQAKDNQSDGGEA